MAAVNRHIASKEVIAYEEDGKPIQIVFDTWTPRPHFIVVQCQPKPNATPAELQVACEMINRFLRANPQFDDQAILSFHCGKWYQQHTSEWHAHLCVPEKPYLERARNLITEITTNKEWKGAKTIDEGINNWRLRKITEYTKYQNECIQKRIPDQTLVANVTLSALDASSNEFKLVWTSPAPRIGILAQSPANSTLTSLYTFMKSIHIAAEKLLAQYDKNFVNFGCHLCLYVCGQSGTAVTCRTDRVLMENGTVIENPNIVGYIQLDESQYVQWLPRHIRQLWLNEFRDVQHFVRT